MKISRLVIAGLTVLTLSIPIVYSLTVNFPESQNTRTSVLTERLERNGYSSDLVSTLTKSRYHFSYEDKYLLDILGGHEVYRILVGDKERLRKINLDRLNKLEHIERKDPTYKKSYNLYTLNIIELLKVYLTLESLQEEKVYTEIGKQIKEDLTDKNKEHGGLVFLDDDLNLVLKKYKSAIYTNNESYIWPSSIEGTPTFAYYHFHASEVNSSRYAGPSDTDLIYPYTNPQFRRSRRFTSYTGLVFTKLEGDKFNADIYSIENRNYRLIQKPPIVVDLGNYSY